MRLDADAIEIAAPVPDGEILAVHEALDQLAAQDAEKAQLVKLRYFAGLSIKEAAAGPGISERTAKRHWTYDRAWLSDTMRASWVNYFCKAWPFSAGNCAWVITMPSELASPGTETKSPRQVKETGRARPVHHTL